MWLTTGQLLSLVGRFHSKIRDRLNQPNRMSIIEEEWVGGAVDVGVVVVDVRATRNRSKTKKMFQNLNWILSLHGPLAFNPFAVTLRCDLFNK